MVSLTNPLRNFKRVHVFMELQSVQASGAGTGESVPGGEAAARGAGAGTVRPGAVAGAGMARPGAGTAAGECRLTVHVLVRMNSAHTQTTQRCEAALNQPEAEWSRACLNSERMSIHCSSQKAYQC
jgi:hypothetical protein